jgi:alpha-glucosidase (family GH31 glycosyl hydrolase)
VEVYLPAGRWVRLWADKEYGTLEGGVYETVPAPVGSPPSSKKRARRRGAT